MGKFGGKEGSPATVYPVKIDYGSDGSSSSGVSGGSSGGSSASNSASNSNSGSSSSSGTSGKESAKVYVLLEGDPQAPPSRPSARVTRARASAWLSMGERPRPLDKPICLSLLDGVLSPGRRTYLWISVLNIYHTYL